MFRQGAQLVRRVVVRTAVVTVTTVGVLEVTTHLPSQGRSSEFYHMLANEWVTPLMRRFLDPEVAHHMAIAMVQRGLAPRHHPSATEQRINVASTVFGQHFTNPVGLGAGFDKDGVIIAEMFDLGFGFVEIGTVTPLPQPGNDAPRMFRLPEDLGIINRYGFNSLGAAAVEQNLIAYRQQQQEKDKQQNRAGTDVSLLQQIWVSLWNSLPTPSSTNRGLVGVNIGKNKDSTDAAADYVSNIKRLGPYADYLVINISSPNTEGLRDLQTGDALRSLLQQCLQARNELTLNNTSNEIPSQHQPPLLVKLAPDLTDEELQEIATTCLELHMDGLVVTNTTNRIEPNDLISYKHKHESGGLSGAPVKDKSTACIRTLYALTEGRIPIIGVGGIGSGYDAYEKLRAGASLVQIYSMMVYKGPGLVSSIRHELAEIMLQHGQRSLEDVVGLDHEEIAWRRRLERLRMRDNQVLGTTIATDAATTDATNKDDDDTPNEAGFNETKRLETNEQ